MVDRSTYKCLSITRSRPDEQGNISTENVQKKQFRKELFLLPKRNASHLEVERELW